MNAALEKLTNKVFTECDMFAAAGVGFLIGNLYAITVLVLLHKLHGAF